jgi:glucuronoarabinoxylan endo-1,4-beta-xylanase
MKRRQFGLKRYYRILGLFFLVFSPRFSWAGSCTVDATQTNQYIRGFGAASAWNGAGSLKPFAAALWADDNVNGHAGLSMLRTRIDPTDTGSGAAWNNEAAPMTLAKSVNPNVLIWSTEWSPPAAYKGNNNVSGGGSNGALNSSATFTGAASGAANAADTGYAAYLVRYIQYIQSKFGVTLYAVSPQNEPDWDPTYEAAIWNAGQFDVFTQAFHAALQTAGLSTKIMITESFHDNLALAATTMNDATAAPMAGIIGTHLYGGGPNNIATAGWSHLTNQESWETEISDGSTSTDNTMTTALEDANWIHKSMSTGQMNAFHHWWIYAANPSSLIDSAANVVTKRLMVIGNYSKFVRPGFYRMGATAVPSSGVSVTAYKNTNTSSPATIVIVAVNGNNSTISQTFSLNGVNVTSVIPWVTDNNNNLVQQTAVAVSANSFTYNLTGPSVTSFIGVNNAAPTATLTPTPTKTTTSTPTRTPSPTSTRTLTSTQTPTFTQTLTLTPTSTKSPTTTPSSTMTASRTATQTSTATPTSTLIYTPTVSFTPSQTFTGTMTKTTTETLTSTPTQTVTRTFTVTPTMTPTLTDTPIFTPTQTLTSTNSLTASPTRTPTVTATLTLTKTITPTFTPMPTATWTHTPIPTKTYTPTDTSTVTVTPTPLSGPPISTPIPYPNPVSGPTVTIHFILRDDSSWVHLEIFTTDFRKVKEVELFNLPAGAQNIPITLTDNHGSPLANGVYYIVVVNRQGRAIGKLLVMK